jgi:alkylhydroperoxidase/carboxymuconolactone decarboxylase family protein YurZ
MKTLLAIAASVQKGGKNVTRTDRSRQRAGATDKEIHDTVLIAASFCMFNRYVDGLATWAPQDRQFYVNRAPQRAEDGYQSSVYK